MNIIQLELKNLLFSKEILDNSSCEIVDFENLKLAKRNGADEFLIELAKFFRVGIWSRYDSEIHNQLVDHIRNLGIDILYDRSLENCTQFHQNDKFITEKRIKTLNHIGIDKSNLIVIENQEPTNENYGNHYIISEFKGQQENELLDSLIGIIEFANVTDTTRIN